MKKIFTIIVVVIVIAGTGYFAFYRPQSSNNNLVGGDKDEHGCIGSAGYSWCEAKQKCLRVFEEFCADQVVDLVDEIKQATGITLAAKGEMNFEWGISDGKIWTKQTIPGVLYQIDDIKRADYEKIEKFFKDNYQLDINNVADGVVGGLRGYYVDYMACTLNFRHNLLEENENAPTEVIGDSLNVKLECGYFNPNNIANILIGEEIKKLLATKYNKEIADVVVDITKSDDTHARGSIAFLMNGQKGEGGLVLAIKEQGKWKLVYSGNGSVDCPLLKNTYSFSDDLLIGFCD
jgi:hypothetical protein